MIAHFYKLLFRPSGILGIFLKVKPSINNKKWNQSSDLLIRDLDLVTLRRLPFLWKTCLFDSLLMFSHLFIDYTLQTQCFQSFFGLLEEPQAFLKNYFSITVDIQHYISFRGSTWWSDASLPYEVITWWASYPSDTVFSYYDIVDCIPCAVHFKSQAFWCEKTWVFKDCSAVFKENERHRQGRLMHRTTEPGRR